MIALALLVLARGLQEPPEGPPRRNPILEGVAVQAGDSLVLLSELQRYVERARTAEPPGSRLEEERQRARILYDLTTLRLEEQGGADLGLDPAWIDRIRRSNLDAERAEKGLEAYLANLQERGSTALDEESDSERAIYRQLWELKAKGQAFGDARETRDPGVRPGELRDLFAEHRHELAPPTVQLRWLIVSSESAGSPEAARESCEDARRRVLAGEDFALLVEERGVELRDTRGLTPFLPARAFREPALWTFCETAEVDELSVVLPVTDPRTGEPEPRLGYQLAELHQRRTPPPAEFSDPEVQRVLREFSIRRRNERVLGREREQLRRDSFLWLNPLLRGPSEP